MVRGAHCCFAVHVFALGEKFREVGKIEADHSDRAKFVDINHHGKYAFVGSDWAFTYWATSFMQSPAPQIVLTFQNGKFHLATDLMSKPAPSEAEFSRVVRTVRTDQTWKESEQTSWLCEPSCKIPVSLWKNMLEYIYSGHAELAWRLVNQSWPSPAAENSGLLRLFANNWNKAVIGMICDSGTDPDPHELDPWECRKLSRGP